MGKIVGLVIEEKKGAKAPDKPAEEKKGAKVGGEKQK